MSDQEKAPLAAARIVSSAPREKAVPLEYTVEFDGKTYTEVTLRRATGKQIEDYMDALGRGERAMPPMMDFPMEVYDAMDDDDRFAVDEAVVPFLPRRLRVAAEPDLHAGEPTSGS